MILESRAFRCTPRPLPRYPKHFSLFNASFSLIEFTQHSNLPQASNYSIVTPMLGLGAGTESLGALLSQVPQSVAVGRSGDVACKTDVR